MVGLLAAVTLAGARHAELLDKEIKKLSIEEQVEFLKRLRGPWSACLLRRMEIEGDVWPAVDDLYGPVSRLKREEQLKLEETTRTILRKRLLEPIGGYTRAYDKVDKSIRVNRLLNRGLFKEPDLPWGGGSCFNFKTRSNYGGHGSHLRMERWVLSPSTAGRDVGLLLKLPNKTIRDVTVGDFPVDIRLPTAEFEKHCRKVEEHPRATPGQLYLLRFVNWDEHDIVVAFEVLQKDRYGVTFAWKFLRTNPKPTRSKR